MGKKLPYGQSNYRKLINENYIYIDKTQYIEKIENLDSTFIFFLRPRRFGKSLFTSVLENYYDINTKQDFKYLFNETYIGNSPTSKKNSYYILKFNFSGLCTDTKERLEETFLQSINKSFNNFINHYKLDIKYNTYGYPAAVFDDFLSEVSYKIDKPLYVIIDEYDHFANELLSFKTDMFSEIISKTGFVRKWYEILKKGTEGIVDRIFATGVSPITLDSLTSGFNIGTDITRYPNFNEMMGFTEEEVRHLIEISSITINRDEDELIEMLRKNYNGYLFADKGKKRIFNSDMILYYLKAYKEFGDEPQELMDKNIASDYGKLAKIFDLKNKNRNMKILDQILKDEKISANITSQFSMEKDFEDDDFISLLFYLGMLTIDKPRLNRSIMKVPNYVIKALYFDFFMKQLNESINYELDTSEIKEALENIALDGDNTSLISIVERTLNKLSNRDYMTFNEKYIKLIFLTYCFLSRIYLVKSEYEVEEGYIDIALLKQFNTEPEYFALFELKYISIGEYEKRGQKVVEEKLAEAIEQLNKYTKSPELKDIQSLKKWAVVFVGDKCMANIEC